MFILEFPHPALKSISEPITLFNEDLKKLADEMFMTMYENNGIGLSAIQVGHAIRLFVMYVDGEESVFVNPVITESSEEQVKTKEGCLSFPRIYGHVSRPSSVKIEYQDLDGKEYVKELSGIPAVCAQHEIDHLNGITFYDRMSYINKRMTEKKIKKILG